MEIQIVDDGIPPVGGLARSRPGLAHAEMEV
jgi:hypothetical protein